MEETMNMLKKFYLCGIHAVQPQNLMPKWLVRQGEKLKIGMREYPLKNIYIVGFGKAVGGMIPHIANTLQSPERSYIKEGIISVPTGYLESDVLRNYDINTLPQIKLYEGAKSNLPDLASQKTAEKIMKLVRTLNEHDLLFVLISGGGSALLPLPIAPLTLEEKTQIIKKLSLAGATITEINMVRRAISATKSGRLARATKAEVVSFILSDTMDDSLEVIASGPTVPNTDASDAPAKVLQKYNIPLTFNLEQVLFTNRQDEGTYNFQKVHNYIIGNNRTALQCIYDTIKKEELHCNPLILTSSLKGEASIVGKLLAQLSFAILDFLCDRTSTIDLKLLSEQLCIPLPMIDETKLFLEQIKKDSPLESLCLLFGGETTVQVKGRGTGGRNQEMILSASLEFERLSQMSRAKGEAILLSGGTDGIDGPTDAAGAITYFNRSHHENTKLQTHEARNQGLCPEDYLKENNSYEYFSKLSNGMYLLKPGHTGTNVMDIQLLFIKKTA